jgi:hypothetical protein
MIDKAKKIGKGLATSGIIESIKWGFRRLLRRKKPQPQEKIPCLVVEKFCYLLEEFGEFTSRSYSHNIMSVINTVCSPFGSSTEINKELSRLQERYELTVEREYADAKEALECFFKKNEEKEWFDKASRHLHEMLCHYVGFAKPLNELLLIHKPETLKNALHTIDEYYTPMKEHFNYLMNEYIQLAARSKSIYYVSHQKLDMLLPDIPSKESLATFQEITNKKPLIQ